ncbi:3'-5' exoribonuclease 1 [Lamellibrachia satsuma]|nr:3'-5' exoribonuclease 1 [Lamellibrachia satsuma]
MTSYKIDCVISDLGLQTMSDESGGCSQDVRPKETHQNWGNETSDHPDSQWQKDGCSQVSSMEAKPGSRDPYSEWSQAEQSDIRKWSGDQAQMVLGEDPAARTSLYSDVVYKQLAVKNGLINKMTKQQLKEKLAEYKLDTRGLKEALKKRLKAYYKRRKLTAAQIQPHNAKPRVDFLLVIDFEATCQENTTDYRHEIIEFPIVVIDTHKCQVTEEFHSYVKPVVNPSLSEFCIELTAITQEMVESADTFPDVLTQVETWMEQQGFVKPCKFAIVTDGPWDMSRFMKLQCEISKLPFPHWARQWINIRKTFSNMYKCRRTNLASMLENLGMTFEGHQHSGIDDARNIARIALCMMQDGCNMRVNERLHQSGNESTVVTVTRRSNSTDDDESENESKDASRCSRCNGDSEVVSALDGLSLGNCRDNSRKSGQSSSMRNRTDGLLHLEDECVDDLIAYYALQKS